MAGESREEFENDRFGTAGAIKKIGAPKVVLVPGVCRICHCTEFTPCKIKALVAAGPFAKDGMIEEIIPCKWLDAGHTICSNRRCVAKVPMDEIAEIAEAYLALVDV